jgi:MOSC domain-containing protein YiiM
LHYRTWRKELPNCSAFEAPGAFGENFTVEGLDEQSVCIGDVWRVGKVVLAVTQGRQPCFKLNLRFGIADMASRVQNTLRAGWYLRVVEPGLLSAGDRIEVLDRPHPRHSVASLLELIRDRSMDAERLADVLTLPLTPSWRRLFDRRLQSGAVEDWGKRMVGAE